MGMDRDFGEVLGDFRLEHGSSETIGYGLALPRPEGARIPYENADSHMPMLSVSTQAEMSLLYRWWEAEKA